MTKYEITDYIRRELAMPIDQGDGLRPSDMQVQVTGYVRRPRSQVWFADIVSGTKIEPIVVKREALTTATRHQQLPRLTPVVPDHERFPRQAEALQFIEHEFTKLADPCFVSTRVLKYDADRSILVMSRIPGRELLRLLHAAGLPWETEARLILPAYSKMAGKWLRLYHERVNLAPGVRVYVEPSELLDQAADWLSNIYQEDRASCDRVQERLSDCAGYISGLTTAVLHGDYWPGNILVNNGQIGVIDILGWAEGPVWLDISYYLLHLRAVSRQVWLHNLSWPNDLLENAEDEFLAGYFGEEAVDPHVRFFFQVFALLAKWSRNVETLRQSGGLQRAKKRLSNLWRGVYYRSLMSSYLGPDRA